jgi:hypothetical protein
VRPDTALFLERAHVLEQWDKNILDKKMEWEKVMIYEIPPHSAS